MDNTQTRLELNGPEHMLLADRLARGQQLLAQAEQLRRQAQAGVNEAISAILGAREVEPPDGVPLRVDDSGEHLAIVWSAPSPAPVHEEVG